MIGEFCVFLLYISQSVHHKYFMLSFGFVEVLVIRFSLGYTM